MQDGDVDVYIVLDDKANAPESEEYTALLTVEDQNSSTDVAQRVCDADAQRRYE